MTPAEMVAAMRARGFFVRLDGSRLVADGPPPRDEHGAREWLHEHAQDVAEVLRAEAQPAVQAVLEVFPDARLVDVRRPGGAT